MTKLKELERLLGQGQIGRREFLARATAMGALAAVSPAIMSGTAKAATPKKGGTIRFGMGHGSTTDSLDPGTFENAYTQLLGFGIRSHITEISNTGDLVGNVAESWDASDDAVQWTFKIRQGVEFHNGKTLDAADVAASINHHRGEESKSAAKPIVDPITDIKVDGKDTVVFTLQAGDADFPIKISDYHLAIMPAKDDGVDWQSGVGTGPFSLESYEPGVRGTMKRNPNYHMDGRGHFDAAELLTIADVAARTNALTTGEIDVMDRCDIKTVHLLKRRPGLRVEETTGTAHYTFAMRTDTAPFDNNHVRLALKYAVDRDALLKSVLRGHGVVGNDHPISLSNRYHAGELEQRTYDPDKAKFHLKKADLTSLTVDLSAADAAFGGAVDAAVLYKEHAAKIGITINVVREPNDGYWSNVWLKKPWCAVYWGGRPTEDWMFSTAYASGAAWNDTYWEHDRFNKLLLEARAELDEAKRRAMYVEMQTIVSNEGGVVVPMFNNYIFAMADKVKHDDSMAANLDLDGLKALERWWIG
jgi:peptide/nickel transport system substrate-binding protein